MGASGQDRKEGRVDEELKDMIDAKNKQKGYKSARYKRVQPKREVKTKVE